METIREAVLDEWADLAPNPSDSDRLDSLAECGWHIVSVETLAAALAATDPTTPFEYDMLGGVILALRSREARDRAALILSALDRA